MGTWTWLRKHSTLCNGTTEMIEMWRRHSLREYVLTLIDVIEPGDWIWILARAGIAYETGSTILGSAFRGMNFVSPKVGARWAIADEMARLLYEGGPDRIQAFNDAINVKYVVVNGQLEPRRG